MADRLATQDRDQAPDDGKDRADDNRPAERLSIEGGGVRAAVTGFVVEMIAEESPLGY